MWDWQCLYHRWNSTVILQQPSASLPPPAPPPPRKAILYSELDCTILYAEVFPDTPLEEHLHVVVKLPRVYSIPYSHLPFAYNIILLAVDVDLVLNCYILPQVPEWFTIPIISSPSLSLTLTISKNSSSWRKATRVTTAQLRSTRALRLPLENINSRRWQL